MVHHDEELSEPLRLTLLTRSVSVRGAASRIEQARAAGIYRAMSRRPRRMPGSLALAVTPLVPTPLPIWVAARAGLGTIVLAIALDALLLLDFTGTVLGALAFHRQLSFPQDSTTTAIVMYFSLYATPFGRLLQMAKG